MNGYAFGKGVYMADVSSKSANYCQSGSNAEAEAKKHNAISTLGVGRTAPQGWTDGSIVHDDLKGVQLVCPLPMKLRDTLDTDLP